MRFAAGCVEEVVATRVMNEVAIRLPHQNFGGSVLRSLELQLHLAASWCTGPTGVTYSFIKNSHQYCQFAPFTENRDNRLFTQTVSQQPMTM
jgi:hypothetical protein